MTFQIEVDEWLAQVQRIGRLEGAIAAHEMLTADDRRLADSILYAIAKEGHDG